MSNVTVYIGIDSTTRSTVSNFTTINSTGNYTVSATKNFYLAVLPVNGRLISNFTMIYRLVGSKIPEDTSFADAFWPKAIGIVVGVLAFFAILIGFWSYVQN